MTKVTKMGGQPPALPQPGTPAGQQVVGENEGAKVRGQAPVPSALITQTRQPPSPSDLRSPAPPPFQLPTRGAHVSAPTCGTSLGYVLPCTAHLAPRPTSHSPHCSSAPTQEVRDGLTQHCPAAVPHCPRGVCGGKGEQLTGASRPLLPQRPPSPNRSCAAAG